jgi:polysaccharide biosynthesis protein PelC
MKCTSVIVIIFREVYMSRRLLLSAFLALSTLLLGACATTSGTSPSAPLDAGARWALLPLSNHTDTPQAALAAEALTEHLLRLRGVSQLQRYPATLARDTLFEPSERRVIDDARAWAKQQGVRYGVSGAVEEWRYKVGVDGEPAVGVSLQVIDLSNDTVVWSAAGGQAGWSRSALSATAHTLIDDLLDSLPLQAVAR